MIGSVELVEVSPRDGLQPLAAFVPTRSKIALIESLHASGLRRIEVTSFVGASVGAQFADAAEIVAAANALPGLDAQVLVPTARHAERALATGARHLAFVLSASEWHNRNNVRRSPAESAGEYARIAGLLPAGTRLRLNLATAFDCPMTGRVAESDLLALLSDLVAIAPGAEIALCDTTGRASPRQVAEAFASAERLAIRDGAWAFHGHDTYGMGVANCLAAWQAGVGVIDASCAGLGGCPFAPGATGNVATEDVAWLFQSMQVSTGVDLDLLLAAAASIAQLPGANIGGRVRAAMAARLVPAAGA